MYCLKASLRIYSCPATGVADTLESKATSYLISLCAKSEDLVALAYVILFAAKCYRPLLITDDIVSIIICNGLITLLFLLCSYRSEKKYRIFSEINGKYIN